NIQGFLGQSDVIKSLQTMPGINFYGDGSTIFYVRGGARDQNMILVDEAPVYNPAHMLGFFSVFTTASLNSIKVYKGNMPASYGGRISSLIDVKLKEGNIDGLSLHGNTGPIATTLNMEGPLFKQKSTYYISARRSHFKWIFSGQNENIELLHFHDFNIKYNYRLNNNNRLFFSLYSGADKFKNRNNNQSSSGIGWNNLACNLRWNHVFGDRMFSNTSIILSNYDYKLHTSFEDNKRWNTGISLAALKTDFSFYASPGNTYRAGLVLSSHNYSPGNYYSGSKPDPLARGVPVKRADENVIYLDFENEIAGGLRLNYGLRWTNWYNRGPTTEYVYDENYRPIDTINYSSNKKYNSYSVLEPRLNLSYSVTGHIKTSLSYTHNVQFEHLITNSISPFTSLEVWLPAGPNIKPASSDQVSLGFSMSSQNSSYSFDIELYNKVINNYVSYVDHAYMLFNPHVESELRYGRGRSYGLETLLRKSTGNPTGWISHTWSRTILDINDLNNNKPFPSRYDRPHNFSAHIDWYLLPGCLFSASWTFCSGSPITTPTGFYYYKGYQVPFYDTRNNDRLPDYHRLDLSTEIRLNKEGSAKRHSLKIALYNAYGRKNPFTINFNKIINDSGALKVPSDRSEEPELQSSMMYVHGAVPSITYHFNF
ncbi:MAG: TonB-dependent receptor plug domain-containing protein, partial [Bacteroidales bacterium]|nr:TonB-dependent receptor plug domain-containing protein [Bacteroidales bacterium]